MVHKATQGPGLTHGHPTVRGTRAGPANGSGVTGRRPAFPRGECRIDEDRHERGPSDAGFVPR
ncbi:hypothetical protein GCM10009787_16950 [Streptomyces bangladeshensis]|uniref:Uncharacterized protein n=1 Tax=Streptomyces bangladeshensis TaxID=295352 RepID=A0ABN3BDC1_9ACTN